MLDKRSQYLLKVINKECSEGTYKVLETTDLISSMPKKYKADHDFINQIMTYLSAGEYISIKYYDNDVYCVSPLPRGRRFFEAEAEEKVNKKRTKKLVIWLSFFFLIISFGTNLLSQYIIMLIGLR